MKKLAEITRINMNGMVGKVYKTRIEFFEDLKRNNPERTISYDKRCRDFGLDSVPAFVRFKKMENGYVVSCIDIWDDTCLGGYDTYVL